MYRLTDAGLELKVAPETIKEVVSPSFVAIRQRHHSFTAITNVKVDNLTEPECAGLVLIQNNEYNLRVEANAKEIRAILCEKGEDKVLGSTATKGAMTKLAIKIEGLSAKVLADDALIGETSVANLSTEVAGGFVGCCVGMYASSNGAESNQYATFENFKYEAK